MKYMITVYLVFSNNIINVSIIITVPLQQCSLAPVPPARAPSYRIVLDPPPPPPQTDLDPHAPPTVPPCPRRRCPSPGGGTVRCPRSPLSRAGRSLPEPVSFYDFLVYLSVTNHLVLLMWRQ